jgi:hypothetical protein
MSRARQIQAAVAFLFLGCDGSSSNSIAVVSVTAAPGMPTVTQLRVVISNGGSSDSKMFPRVPVAGGITFDTSFAVTFPTSRSGYLDIAVSALDPSGHEVATGDNTTRIVPGGRADVTVHLALVPNTDAGLPGGDAGIADTPGPDLARADGPVTGPDVAQPGPDLRGTGGIGGTTGTGGTTSTGGVTTLPATGSGGVTSTGGSTARPTGGITGSGGVGGVMGTGGRSTSPPGSGGIVGTGGLPGTGGVAAPDGGTEPCVPAETITGSGSGNTGTLGTTGAYCFRTPDNIGGWNCSNFTGRTIKVNGVTVTCGAMPLPPKVDGYYYFDISGGTGAVDYASIYWY